MTAVQTGIPAIPTEVTAVLTEMTANQAEVIASQAIQTEINAAVQTEFTAIKTEGTVIPTKMTVNQTDATAVKTIELKVTANQTEATANQTDVTANQTKVTANKTKVSANQPEVTDNQTVVTAIQTEFTSIQTEGTEIPTAATAVQTELTANQTKGTANQSKVSANQPEVIYTQTEATTNQVEVTANQTEFTSIQTVGTEIPAQATAVQTEMTASKTEVTVNPRPVNQFENIVSGLLVPAPARHTDPDVLIANPDSDGYETTSSGSDSEGEVNLKTLKPKPDIADVERDIQILPDAPNFRLDIEAVELENSQTQLDTGAGEAVSLTTYNPKRNDNEPEPRTRFDRLLSELLEPQVEPDIQAVEPSHLIMFKSEPVPQTVHPESEEFESAQGETNIEAQETVIESLGQERDIDNVWPDPEIAMTTQDTSEVNTPEAEADIGTEKPDNLNSFEQEPVIPVIEPDTQLVDPNCKASVGSRAIDTQDIPEVKDNSTIETFASDMAAQLCETIPFSVPDFETTPPEPNNGKPESEPTSSEPDTLNPDSDTLLTRVEAVGVKPTREHLIRPTKPERNVFCYVIKHFFLIEKNCIAKLMLLRYKFIKKVPNL